jgi:hypothetical protein
MKQAVSRLKIDTGSTGGILRLVIIGTVGIIGIALAIKMIKNSKKMGSGKNLVEDENVKLAMELNTAIHPSRSWLGNLFTGANVDEIFRISQYIDNYDDVAKEYQNLYDESLSHELQDALGNEFPELLKKLGAVAEGRDLMTSAEINNIAKDLNSEMSGANWSGRDLAPFNKLLRISDNDFKRIVSAYNGTYDDFREMLNNESGFSVFGAGSQYYEFEELKEKILTRYDNLF